MALNNGLIHQIHLREAMLLPCTYHFEGKHPINGHKSSIASVMYLKIGLGTIEQNGEIINQEVGSVMEPFGNMEGQFCPLSFQLSIILMCLWCISLKSTGYNTTHKTGW